MWKTEEMWRLSCRVRTCALLCTALSNLIEGMGVRGCASSAVDVVIEGRKPEILLQVNLGKSSQHEIVAESPQGALAAIVGSDGSTFAAERMSESPLFFNEQPTEGVTNFTEHILTSDPTMNRSVTSNSSLTRWLGDYYSQFIPEVLKTRTHEQVTALSEGFVIILGGIMILVGNCLLNDKTAQVMKVDAWKASWSGKTQQEIAEEVHNTPRRKISEEEMTKGEISEALSDSLSPDYSKTYRILGEDVVRDEVLCDYVIVMPLKGASRANLHISGAHIMRINWDKEVDGLQLAREVFKSPNKVHLCTDEELERRFNSEMTGEQYHEEMRTMLAETLTSSHFGLVVGSDPSADHDEIFVKLSVPRHNDTIAQYAGNFSYLLPLNDATYARIGKSPKMDAECNLTRAFTEFFPEHEEYFESFREIDIIRLLNARLDKHLNFTALCNQGVVAAHFSPHNYSEVESMCETWANLWTWYRIPTHDNDDKIRNYFGEEVAWMFVWNVHYVRWLCIPAMIGAFVYFRMFLSIVKQHEIQVGFAIMMALWCTLFNCFYDRQETRIRHRWGMHEFTPLATLFARNDFDPDLDESWRVLFISIFGDVLALMTVGLAVGGTIAIDRWFSETSRWWIHSLLVTSQILILDYWWRNVSQLLVHYENHKHQDKWLRSWTRKMFCIRLFNNLYPFLYVGFFKKHYSDNGCKPFDSCLHELSWDILSYFAVRVIKEIVANLWRLGVVRMQMIHESLTQINTPVARFTHTYLELQAKALPYNDVVKMNDWIEQVLTFAFVACFSVVLPCISFIALLTSLFRTRLVAHRNALYLRRPLPRGSRGIEAWREMLVLTEVIAVVINLGFAIFVMKPLCDLPLGQKCVIFFVAEHLILAVKMACKNKFPDMPSDVEKIDRACGRFVRRSFIDVKRHPVEAQVVCKPHPSIGPNAFGGRNSTMRRAGTTRSFVQNLLGSAEVRVGEDRD